MNKKLAMMIAAATIVSTAGCSDFVLKTVVQTVDPYFHGPGIDGTQFEQVSKYAPGYLAAMNRIIDIDFDTFVPSHFGYGTKQDLIDWRDMMEDGRRLAQEAIQSSGTPGVRNDQMGKYFDAVYYPMREKYGEWHGFNDMFVLNLVRDVVGEALGY